MSEPELVDVTYKAPKQLNDVRVCVVELIRDMRAGKSVAKIAEENLGPLYAAVEGFDQVGGEVKAAAAQSAELAGHTGGQILGVFLEPKPVQPLPTKE